MVLGAHRSSAIFLLFCAACGGGSATLGIGDDAGPESGADGSARTPSPSVSCRLGDPTAISCDPIAEMCIDDYAGAAGFDPHQQCRPLPDPCRDDRTCACVSAHFRCGITTTCSDGDGGMVSVACQPD